MTKKNSSARQVGRGTLIASVALMAFIAAGCGSSSDPEVGSDPADPGTGTGGGAGGDAGGGGTGGDAGGGGTGGDAGGGGTGGDAGGGGTGGDAGGGGTGGDAGGGGVSTSQFCDEGTAGSIAAQPGDPAVDSIAAAVPGAPTQFLDVSCTMVGVEGSDAMPLERTLGMDRANLKFFVNGQAVVQGEEAFRWVDSREYCAKPAPLPQPDGSVLEIVAKFRPDTNQPTYYRQKSSNQDGSRISQVECIPGAQ